MHTCLKRTALLAILAALSAGLPAAVFTDSLDREVTIPDTIERVVPSGNLSQMVLYSIAPKMIAGWSLELTDSARKYYHLADDNLPVFGTLFGKRANLSSEALMAANPDIVIDMGEIKGSEEAMRERLDRLQNEIKVPVITIDAYLDNIPEVYRTAGALLGHEDKAEQLAEYAEEALRMAESARERIKEPLSVYYSSSRSGLEAIASGNFHGEVIEKAGARNIVPSAYGEARGDISMEQLYIWNPDVILLQEEEAYRKVISSPEWKLLDAVRNRRVYKIPSEPYPFLDSPPASNRIIGIYWLGSLLYPELYPVDIIEKTIEFYSLFYNYELTEEEAVRILGIH